MRRLITSALAALSATALIALPATSPAGASPASPITRLGPATATQVSVLLDLTTDEARVARDLVRKGHHRGRGIRLSEAQVAARYGAPMASVAAVYQWAADHGLTARVNGARTHVDVKGTGRRVGRALGVHLFRFRRPGVRAYVAATSRPRVPATLRGMVDAVVGLDHRPPARARRDATPAARLTAMANGSAWNCATSPYASIRDSAGLFPATPLGTVAPYGFTSVGTSLRSPSQLVVAALPSVNHVPNQAFFNAYVKQCRFDAGPAPSLTSVTVGGAPLPQAAPGASNLGEQGMDSIILGSVVPPNAQVAFYTAAGNADHPTADILNALIDRAGATAPGMPPLTVVSLSVPNQESPGYGPGTGNNIGAHDKLLARLGLMGVSVLASSGDWGSQGAPANQGDGNWSCAYTGLISVNWPASSPYVTGVGGIEWSDDPQRPGTWNEGTAPPPPSACDSLSASGGGQSMWYPVPTWQQAQAVAGTNGRNVPDLAFLAGAPGFIRDPQSQWGWDGGTSAAAPFVAAGIARLNAERLATGKKPLGFLNPIIYGFPATTTASSSASGFLDVSMGTNDLWGVGCCTALNGYDMTTGLGVPLLNTPAWTSVP